MALDGSRTLIFPLLISRLSTEIGMDFLDPAAAGIGSVARLFFLPLGEDRGIGLAALALTALNMVLTGGPFKEVLPEAAVVLPNRGRLRPGLDRSIIS